MSLFDVAAILIALTAVFSFVNARYIRLPTIIGVMFLSLAVSLVLALIGGAAGSVRQYAATLVGQVNFNRTVFHGMLAFLLFAGALQLDLALLARQWGAVAVLAFVGTALSTAAVGGGLWFVLNAAGSKIPLIHCLLFGALVSPTDPVAVLGILKSIHAPKRLETLMSGESLFNDGVGVVFFFVLLDIAAGKGTPTLGHVAWMFLWETGGGILVGMVCGFLVNQLVRRVDYYRLEIEFTLALAMGSYALADAIGASAPLATVAAGLFMGSRGRTIGMSKVTQEHLDAFWELVDELLNSVLFMLIGLEVLVLPFHRTYLLAGAAAVVVALAARWASVAGLVTLMGFRHDFGRGAITVLTWGGLRGALSVAMALSLPKGEHHDLIVAVTYCVVVFSVLVQGLTVGKVTRRVTVAATP